MSNSQRRHRCRLFAAAAVCLVIVAVLAVLVQIDWSSLQDVDTDIGTPAEAWTAHHARVVTVLLAIEVMFGTVSTILYVLALVLVLWFAGHRRAVVWSVAVMAGTSATTTALKVSFRRQRPEWDDSIHTLTSFSFPSGHASGIASGVGVVTILTMLYVQRKAVRRAAVTTGAALVVLVGADRILLGVHNLSDVIAGYAVAGLWIFATLALYPPEDVCRTSSRSQRPSGQPDEN